MPNSPNRKNVSLSKDVLESFEYLYPKLTKPFLERAMLLALEDKTYFEKVWFNPKFIRSL